MSEVEQIWTGVKAPTEYEGMTFENSDVLHKYWQVEKQRLTDSGDFAKVEAQLFRKLSIETGLIEGAYTIIEDKNRGVTVALIEKGFQAAELSHDTTDNEDRTREILQAQYDAYVEHAMPVIKGERPFNEFFLKAAHKEIMGPKPTHKVPNPHTKTLDDRVFEAGVYKDFENFPHRPDGVQVLYCPWLQTPPEMEKLFALYEEWNDKIHPIALATWFHHEFVKIHPFPDGNGRVARLMASTILIKAGFMPFHVDRLERPKYIQALDDANEGKVEVFAGFVDRAQWPLLAGTAELALDEVQPGDYSKPSSNIAEASKRFASLVPKRSMQVPVTQEMRDLSTAILDTSSRKAQRAAEVVRQHDTSISIASNTNKNLEKWLEEYSQSLSVAGQFTESIQHILALPGINVILKCAIVRVSIQEPLIMALMTRTPDIDGKEKSEAIFFEASNPEKAKADTERHLEKCVARLIDRLAELRNQQLSE